MCLLTMVNDSCKTYNVWNFTFIKFNLKILLNPSSNTCQPIMLIQVYAFKINSIEW